MLVHQFVCTIIHRTHKYITDKVKSVRRIFSVTSDSPILYSLWAGLFFRQKGLAPFFAVSDRSAITGTLASLAHLISRPYLSHAGKQIRRISFLMHDS